jgi:hypothetical protein
VERKRASLYFSSTERPSGVALALFKRNFNIRFAGNICRRSRQERHPSDSVLATGEDDISSKIVFSRQVATYVTRNP